MNVIPLLLAGTVTVSAVIIIFCIERSIHHFIKWKALERLPEMYWLIQEGFVTVNVTNKRWSHESDCVVYTVTVDDSLSPWKVMSYDNGDGYKTIAHASGYKPMVLRKELLEKVGINV